MNKAISTALLLAAGTALANAASVYTNITNTESDNLVAAWNFDTNGDASFGEWTWTDGFSAADGYAVIGSSTSRPYSGNSEGLGFSSNDFTISFDVKGVSTTAWKNLLTLYTNSGSLDNYAMSLQVNGSGNLMLYPNNFGGVNTNSLSVCAAPTDTWTTITITSGDGLLSVYVDGSKVSSQSFTPEDSSLNVTGIQFGSTLGGGRQLTSADIDNVAIWSTALTASQVAALPEPSAFGLLAGLGALALVAARRRRGRKA